MSVRRPAAATAQCGMKIAAVQMVSTPDWPANRDAAARLIRRAAAAGAALVALPEYFCIMGRRDTDKLRLAEAPGDGPIQAFLAATARDAASGSSAARCRCAAAVPGQRAQPLLRLRARGPRGRALRQDPPLAFDNGRESYDEGRTLQAGRAPVALQAGGALRMGLSICYDLRFPELYRALMEPAVRPDLRAGGLHLHHRPRALGTAAARPRGGEPVLRPGRGAGRHARERPPHLGPQHGRRPLGRGASRCTTRAKAWSSAEVDPARLAQVRMQLPALRHRRL